MLGARRASAGVTVRARLVGCMPVRWGPTVLSPTLQDWAAAEELHMGAGSGSSAGSGDGAGLVGAGHYVLYLELAAPVPGARAVGWRVVPRQSASYSAARGLPLSALHRSNPSPWADTHTIPYTHPFAGAQLAAFEAELQRCLAAANAQYGEYVQEGRLGPPELRLLRPGAFLALRADAVARGAAPAQCKPPVAVQQGGWQQALLERWREGGGGR